MRDIDSDALRLVAQALGVGNPVTAVQQVQFDDGVLQQVLDVAALVRRAGTIAPSAGLWTVNIINSHNSANAVSTTIDPYNLTGAGNGYPVPIGPELDVWLCDVSGGTGIASTIDIDEPSFLGIDYPATTVAVGTAAAVTQIVKTYTSTVTMADGRIQLTDAGDAEGAGPKGRGTAYTGALLPRRIPRGGAIRWETKSTGITTLGARLLLGIFPAGLGQDAIGAG